MWNAAKNGRSAFPPRPNTDRNTRFLSVGCVFNFAAASKTKRCARDCRHFLRILFVYARLPGHGSGSRCVGACFGVRHLRVDTTRPPRLEGNPCGTLRALANSAMVWAGLRLISFTHAIFPFSHGGAVFFCRDISMCRARAPGSAAVVRLCIILVVQCVANNGAWCGGAREANCLELEAGGEVAPRPPRRRVAGGGSSRTHVPTHPRLSFEPSSAAARFTREITRVPIIHATTATSARNDQRQPGGPISRARRAIRARLALLRWRGE